VTEVLLAGAVLVAGLAPVAATVVLVATRHPGEVFRILVDLLLAAGLLRVAATDDWRTVGAVAVIVLVRVVSHSSRASRATASWGANPLASLSK
jgi:hypothetical protein